MTFALTVEQRQLQQLVRKFCEAKSPISEVRRLMDTEDGFDTTVWNQLGSELGLQSLAIPERFGGAGYSLVELCLVIEEMGRALLCVPFLSSIALGANAILVGGTDEQRECLLPGIASGEVRAALAFAERTDAGAPGEVATVATARPTRVPQRRLVASSASAAGSSATGTRSAAIGTIALQVNGPGPSLSISEAWINAVSGSQFFANPLQGAPTANPDSTISFPFTVSVTPNASLSKNASLK